MTTPSSQPSVLVIDDDEIILVALRETLMLAGYAVVTVNNPLKAIEHLKEQEFGVIVSDQRMAEMTGLEFFEKAKSMQPNASRILITGVLNLKVIIDAVNQGEIFRFIAKPWIREELLATVRNAMQRYQLLVANSRLQEDTLRLNASLSQANQRLEAEIEETKRQKQFLDSAHEALRLNFEQSLELCFRILTSFHPMLGEMTKSVMDICKVICESGYLTANESHVLRVSAVLHNIGLIGVSREILSRSFKNPASLEPAERGLVYNHPIYGQILAAFVDTLESVGATIRSHHERWDGTGYPDGLSAEAIPKTARYLAVVSHYVEDPRSREDAIEHIIAESGKAFDPEVVRLFLKVTRSAHLPKKIREVLFDELQIGMSLAKGVYSPTGLLLIPEGHVLSQRTLEKMRDHNKVYPIPQQLLVYV